ncbi:DUF3176 domain-containing protein [Aspergillus foveolatus]|uniref:DUF3176 domain-containing protein n=1 Tax=Aspergillus foveolatus TaxID=210207 RepID=UPI003CCCF535
MAEDNSSPGAQEKRADVSKVSSDPPSATIEYKRHPMYSPSEWLLESISSILALGLLLAIALIFWHMDNKPLDAWTARVSLNATISILTTACTTALMHSVSSFIAQSKWLHFKTQPRKLAHFELFEGASRGVWGSILLLATIPWNLATIGAFITILRLAFSPFAQQVVLIEQRNVTSLDDTVTFGYAHNYTYNGGRLRETSSAASVPQDPGMQAAIYQGLYGINITESFSCPGTCRWNEPYISLGFKAECKNVTQETLRSQSCAWIRDGVEEQCNMTTPAGLDIMTEYVQTTSATNYYMNAVSLIEPEYLDPLPEIVKFAVFRSTPGGSSPNGSYNIVNEDVTDCSLFLTAYEYRGAQANGSVFSFAQKREVDFGVSNPWNYRRTVSNGVDFTDLWYTNATKTDEFDIPELGMKHGSLLAIGTFFVSPSVVSKFVEGDGDNQVLGVAAALSGDVDINDRFSRMAAAMTDYLRYGPNKLTAHGERIESVPFVSIRWGYFAVPIVTEGFAILFAILSIINNRKSRNVPLWKSSTLAVLECRHDERLGLLQTTGKDLAQIEAEAAKTEVRLQ